MKRPISIYRSLLTSLLLVVAILSCCILLATWLQARSAVKSVSQAAILRTMDQVDARLNAFFDPPKRVLQLMRDWGEQGRLAHVELEQFTRELAPIIENYPQITSLLLADETGRERMLLRTGGTWLTRESRADEWGRTTRWTERTSPDATPRSYEKDLDYDCRKRLWYEEAVRPRTGAGAAETQWTEPYIFFTTKEPGITASIAFRGPQGVQRVLAYDVLLNDITEFTRTLAPSRNGLTAVLTGKGEVLGLPGVRRFADDSERTDALLKAPEAIGVPVLAETMRQFHQTDAPANRPFQIRSEGRRWWAQVRWIELSSDRRLALVVMVPEADLLGDAAQRRAWILAATALAIVFAAYYALVLARRYSVPIQGLVRGTERIEAGDLTEGERIPTRLLEVRSLAGAQEKMRVAIGTLLKLERDLQIARQIQQDTFPDELPNLPGYELEAWSYPADETGGDTYDLVGLRSHADSGTETTLVVQGSAESALLLLADATGHGIGPALSVTQVRAMLRMAARAGSNLEAIASHMNEQLCSDLADDRFITAWLGTLDARSHELTTFSAGQAPLIHYKAALDEMVVFGSDAPPMGIIDALSVKIGPPIVMEPGDLYAVLSDGIFEAKNAERDEFGDDRVVAVLRANHARSPREILDALRAELGTFTGSEPQDDDRTAILIKRQA